MIFAAIVLATFWAWEFMYAYASWLPDYIAHFAVPGIAFGMLFLPHIVVLALAAAALVGLLHRFTKTPGASKINVPRRRSNIPPPP